MLRKVLCLTLCLILGTTVSAHAAVQRQLEGVRDYPSLPQPYHMLDWQDITLKFIDLVTDPEAEGTYFPVFSWNAPGFQGVEKSFAFPSYVGREMTEGGGESVTLFMMLLSGTLMGLDMRDYKGENFLDTTQVYYNPTLGTFFNNPGSFGGQTFWYELFPAMLHTMLSYEYPDEETMALQNRNSADAWYEACVALGGENLDFDCTSFDLLKKEKVQGDWKEPDAAAGIALIEYLNYAMRGDERYLQAAKWCMDWLEKIDYNPLYEVMGYFAPLLAARMNVELGTNYSVGRFLNWMPGNDSRPRQGWGVINENWHGYDCYGIAGSEPYAGGYAFAMNTFVQCSAIAPVARYDGRYADAIGKWLLNSANALRLFYPGQLPPGHETCADMTGDPDGVIPYEGLREDYNNVALIAMGDPLLYGWAKTDRSLYSGAPSGMLAAILEETETEGILRFDLLKTDYAHGPAYPTALYYNPYDTEKIVTVSLPEGTYDLYDSAAGSKMAENRTGQTEVSLPAGHAAVIVTVPAGAAWTEKSGLLYADGVFVGADRPGVNLISPEKGAEVTGAAEVVTRLDSAGQTPVDMSVTVGDKVLYRGAYMPSVKVDLSECAEGSGKLRVRVAFANGMEETDQAAVKVRSAGNDIASYTPVQLAGQWMAMPEMPGKIERIGAQAYISAPEGETDGGAESPWFFLDLDRDATLRVEVGVCEPEMVIRLLLENAPEGYDLVQTAVDEGESITISLGEILRVRYPGETFTGKQAARLCILATGEENARVSIKRLSLRYD